MKTSKDVESAIFESPTSRDRKRLQMESFPEKDEGFCAIYTKFSRRSKNSTIQRIFEELQSQKVIDV